MAPPLQTYPTQGKDLPYYSNQHPLRGAYLKPNNIFSIAPVTVFVKHQIPFGNCRNIFFKNPVLNLTFSKQPIILIVVGKSFI